MMMTPLRTFPSLFIGRRALVDAMEVNLDDARGVAFTCGACEDVILTAESRDAIRDVVVKCRCGEFNQL
jgi:hypothetical protein